MCILYAAHNLTEYHEWGIPNLHMQPFVIFIKHFVMLLWWTKRCSNEKVFEKDSTPATLENFQDDNLFYYF